MDGAAHAHDIFDASLTKRRRGARGSALRRTADEHNGPQRETAALVSGCITESEVGKRSGIVCVLAARGLFQPDRHQARICQNSGCGRAAFCPKFDAKAHSVASAG